MKHKTLFTNPFLNKETLEFAPVIGQRVHCTFVHCNKDMVIPVPNEYIDWEDVANLYKRKGERMVKNFDRIVKNFDRIVKDIDVMYQDNPIREYLLNEWKAILK
jgi:predicted protein tyrosine phosphatase